MIIDDRPCCWCGKQIPPGEAVTLLDRYRRDDGKYLLTHKGTCENSVGALYKDYSKSSIGRMRSRGSFLAQLEAARPQ